MAVLGTASAPARRVVPGAPGAPGESPATTGRWPVPPRPQRGVQAEKAPAGIRWPSLEVRPVVADSGSAERSTGETQRSDPGGTANLAVLGGNLPPSFSTGGAPARRSVPGAPGAADEPSAPTGSRPFPPGPRRHNPGPSGPHHCPPLPITPPGSIPRLHPVLGESESRLVRTRRSSSNRSPPHDLSHRRSR